MLSIIWDIGVLCVTLLLLIGFHEFGHYAMAKLFSVPVEKFVISPIGGFVKFKKDFVFESIALPKRACIILAGPLFNLILAFLAYWIVFVVGITQPAPVIQNIVPHSVLSQSGITPDSNIMAIDGSPTSTWAAVLFKVLPHLGRSDVLKIQTQSGIFNIKLNNFKIDPVKPDILLSLGIIPKENSELVTRKFSVWHAIPPAFQEVCLYFYVNGVVVEKIITGNISIKSLVGPVGLLSSTLFAAKQGGVVYIAFLGFVSVGLAFINLLPIPGLDGANLLYLIIELFRGKPLSSAVQMLLFRLGIILLTVLMIQALMNDLTRLL
ncbi:MAG TPA: site-2 protease family protein [Gammaproteobacteria bacterium]|nr:site-2 protease family protein [Gammaproteobacteria bacterium]